MSLYFWPIINFTMITLEVFSWSWNYLRPVSVLNMGRFYMPWGTMKTLHVFFYKIIGVLWSTISRLYLKISLLGRKMVNLDIWPFLNYCIELVYLFICCICKIYVIVARWSLNNLVVLFKRTNSIHLSFYSRTSIYRLYLISIRNGWTSESAIHLSYILMEYSLDEKEVSIVFRINYWSILMMT